MSETTFRLARLGEDAAIIDFINDNFDMRLPLINRADFYQFYYAHTPGAAPQFALAEQDGPEALAVLERLLRSLEEPWDLSASPLYRHLPTKEATREVQQIMLQYLLEELDVTTPTGFSTSHVTNPVMVTGTLPYDKEKMLEGIYAMLGTGKESDLHGIVSVSDAAVER